MMTTTTNSYYRFISFWALVVPLLLSHFCFSVSAFFVVNPHAPTTSMTSSSTTFRPPMMVTPPRPSTPTSRHPFYLSATLETQTDDDVAVAVVSVKEEENEDERSDHHVVVAETKLEGDDQDEKEEKEETVVVIQLPKLRETLNHWKRELKTKQWELTQYIHKQNIELDLKPKYERHGKIDKYIPHTIYDQTTFELNDQLHTAKQHILSTQMKIQQQEGVQESIIQQRIDALKREHELQMKQLQEEHTKQLEEKQLQIDTMTNEIKDILGQLKNERNTVLTQEGLLTTLQTKLETSQDTVSTQEGLLASLRAKFQEQELEIQTLHQERNSLRSLAKQGWKVFRTRVFKKRNFFFLGKGKSQEIGDGSVTSSSNSNTEQLQQEPSLKGMAP